MPLARRGALTLLLALGLIMLTVGWMTSGQADGQAGGGRAEVYREAVLGRPTRINPLVTPANQAEADLVSLIFSGLMRLGPDGLPRPELAERWEVTPDGLTYTFHLRPDVTWHDGAGFDAEDVAFTIRRIQTDTFDGSPSLQAEWEGVQVFVADPLTVLMRLPEPAADFLARATLGIVPEHLAAEMEAGDGFEARPFERAPVGTGPYRLDTFTSDEAVLHHNTSYVLGTPAIPRIHLRFTESEARQVEWLETGVVDAALLPESATMTVVDTLANTSTALRATTLQSDAFTILYLNNQRGALTDPRTRRALAASIDVVGIVRAAGVPEIPAEGVIPVGSWAREGADDEEPTAESPEVEALWTAARWERGEDGARTRDGDPLVLELVTNGETERLAIANAIADQLQAAGITIELVSEPAQRVINDYLRAGDYDLALFGWETPRDPDPYAGWHTSQIGAGNVAVFSDPEADALLEAARTTLDITERRELYALFEARFDELGASVIISHPTRTYIHPGSLTGFEPVLLIEPSARFQAVHQWKLEAP